MNCLVDKLISGFIAAVVDFATVANMGQSYMHKTRDTDE